MGEVSTQAEIEVGIDIKGTKFPGRTCDTSQTMKGGGGGGGGGGG